MRCSVALTVAVDRGLGRGAVRLNARNIDRIFASSRYSLELSILLERQRSMENIALNDTGAA